MKRIYTTSEHINGFTENVRTSHMARFKTKFFLKAVVFKTIKRSVNMNLTYLKKINCIFIILVLVQPVKENLIQCYAL